MTRTVCCINDRGYGPAVPRRGGPEVSFSDEEIAYLRSQRLARIATVSADGQPDAVPVGFEFDGMHVYVGGIDPAKTRKFRNVQAGNT
jgi:pyridoxamine 5'-phosphate oxidase family protein